jgi:NitT/TauT family transport system substrate-binding protein
MKLTFLLIASLLLITVGCSTNTSQEENHPLRIGLMPTMDSVAIATAYELGFFENHDVDVELIPFSSARERDAAFQTGNLDGATVDLIAVGLLNEGNFPVRATSVTTAHFTLIATPQYDDLASLENGTVIISNHTAIDFVMDQMLEVYGLEWDHIVREEISNIPARFEMVRNHQADAALISEPFATMAAADGLTVITDTLTIDFNPFVLAFSADVIAHRVEDLRAFYLAYNEAVDFLNSNPIEAHLDLIIDLIGFPGEVINHIKLPNFLRSELPDDEIIETAIRWLTDRRLISNGVEISTFLPDIELY